MARGHQTRLCREEPVSPTHPPVLKPLKASRQLLNLLGLGDLHWRLKVLCEVTALRHFLSLSPEALWPCLVHKQKPAPCLLTPYPRVS